jgi:glycosyltransferase involved in cell wall biosynthesis
MNDPAISIILPAYNCEAYIGKAIQSVLDQTFTDFELIIINDGSTDKTEFIILSFTDERIVYQKNPSNKGLIYTLNRGIEIAKGKYIARMDADEICLPDRLKNQKMFLDENADVSVVSSVVNLLNEKGEITGAWPLDRETITAETIRQKMPVENCIAHPSVMMRAEVIRQFKYNPRQKNIEDYDLWLRLLNRGRRIAKLKDPQLLYRMHGNSVTSIHLKNKNPYFKQLRMKRIFLAAEIFSGHISGFTFLVIATTIIDFGKGIAKAIKKIFN